MMVYENQCHLFQSSVTLSHQKLSISCQRHTFAAWTPLECLLFEKDIYYYNHDGGDIEILKLSDGDGSLCVAPS